MHEATHLPIEAVLPDVQRVLADGGIGILVAPPGAGKTTMVPLALLDAPWRGDGTILVLEPRRIAARGAASRMAQLLGEALGERVGLRARFDSKVSAKTRILVVTEGVFTRMVLDDPELDGIAAVLFDEFHERSLDADFGLALALEARAALRPDLRLLLMSATLDDQRLAAWLGAPVITSEGRTFPIETRYRGRDPNQRIEEQVARAILAALRSEAGSVLAFLPGQGEIERVRRALEEAELPAHVDLCPLYGALTPQEQDRAIRPSEPGRRKVVLATAIAETSLTIDGVRIVVDSGLQRAPRYDAASGTTHLETIRVSRASADQRRGRAGRTEPGIAIRLWDEAQDRGLVSFNRPEILEADLAGFRLDCARWGTRDPLSLPLLDAPPTAALQEAERLLIGLGALALEGEITPHGRSIADLPLPPRLAALVLDGAQHGMAREAAQAAVLLAERNLGGQESDLSGRLDRFIRDRGPRAMQARGMAENWATRATRMTGGRTLPSIDIAMLIARAFPDRVARARGDGTFHLANGRMAALDATDRLAAAPFLVVADLTGTAQRARITLAMPIDRAMIEDAFAERLVQSDETSFDAQAGALRRHRVKRLGALVLERANLPVEKGPAAATALAKAASERGIDRLPWSKTQGQLRARVGFLRAAGETDLPDLSDDALAETADDWLAPFLDDKTALSAITAETLGAALDALLPYTTRALLEREAPGHFMAPTGNAHPIRYDEPLSPLVSLRVQEVFGQKTHPAIANGKLPLTLELLSPAHRPLQVTRDLPGFWAGSWKDVRADMRGQYPKHLWPEKPEDAAPTARAKPRGT